MNKSKRILLFKQDNLIDSQQRLNDTLIEQLSEVLTEFKKLGLGEMTHADIVSVWSGNGMSIVNDKASVKFKDVEFSGMKILPEKALEMTGINVSGFIQKFNHTQHSLRELIRNSSSNEGVLLTFDHKFFVLENGSLAIDKKYFNEWSKINGGIYTENETQNSVAIELQKICEGLNSLAEIEHVQIKGRVRDLITDDVELSRMIFWNGIKFEANYKFVLSH